MTLTLLPFQNPPVARSPRFARPSAPLCQPEATEIISYKIPAFKHKKVLVWYAAFANHCSLFPTAAVIEQFKDELKDFSTSKGTIHFPLDKPMPVDLIKKMVQERLGRSG